MDFIRDLLEFMKTNLCSELVSVEIHISITDVMSEPQMLAEQDCCGGH